MLNNKKKNNKKLVVGLFILFVCLLGLTIYTSFSTLLEEDEIIIKSITPVYDESSTVVVENENVVFNDKNQVVKYNVVLENTQDYDVKITDIVLTTPSEEFLQYKVEGISTEDEIKANSTKELTVSFETMGIKGWGRNFADELTANISFEKVAKQEEVVPPVEDDKEEEKQPEAPATNTEELISKVEKIEIIRVTKGTIEFKENNKLEKGDKLAVWLYSDPVFLGYFDVIETNGIKQIVGLEEALKQANVKEGEHHIVFATEDNETIGYVEVYVSENKNLSSEAVKEESPKEEIEDDGKVENPYTSDKGLLVILVAATTITGIAIIVVSKNKFAKYTIFIIALSSTLPLVNAEETIELPIKLNVSFKSQNVMKPSGFEWDSYDDELLFEDRTGVDYWEYARQIKNFYIQNEITEIDEYEYEFDVTEEENGRVVAYLVERQGDYTCSEFDWEEDVCYDLYLQADGVIYPNEDASYYFAAMLNLDKIYNMSGIDTSEVISMRGMFNGTGELNETFTIDLSNFDTSNVTDMSCMFTYVGGSNPNFTLDISSFDTSKVTDMSYMFSDMGRYSENFTLDVSNFDTSNVTNMSYMFWSTGFSSTEFTLDLGDKFDTSNVTDMSYMFSNAGYSSTEFTLDLGDKFDTSNVTNMASMFNGTGRSSTEFTLDLGDKFDTSNVTDMSYMFNGTGLSSTEFTLDLGDQFDTSDVTDMGSMFSNAGHSSTGFTLDLGDKFDTSNVTNMSWMFYQTGYSSTEFTLDLGDKFDTSNVTNMSYMFENVGYNSPNFTLDVSNFDTGKVTSMYLMFYQTGYNSTKLNTSITISNPNTTSYSKMFYDVATKEGSQIKVNYTSATSSLVDEMIATKSSGANVVKGKCIDCELFSFTVGATNGTTYQAEEGMTWREWINSPYNTGDLVIGTCNCNDLCAIDPEGDLITNGQGDVVQDWRFNLVSPDMLIPQDDVKIYLVDYYCGICTDGAGSMSPND